MAGLGTRTLEHTPLAHMLAGRGNAWSIRSDGYAEYNLGSDEALADAADARCTPRCLAEYACHAPGRALWSVPSGPNTALWRNLRCL